MCEHLENIDDAYRTPRSILRTSGDPLFSLVSFVQFETDFNTHIKMWERMVGWMLIRGVHISMGKFQSGFLKKHIIFPDCICFPGYKKYRSLAF